MNSKAIWVGISFSLLTAIAHAQVNNNTSVSDDQSEEIYAVQPEADGGVTVVKADGSKVYFTKEQVAIIRRANAKDASKFKNGVFCARASAE